MHAARWVPVRAAEAGIDGPVEITTASPAMAAGLESYFAKAGVSSVHAVRQPTGTASVTILTEGLGPAAMTARHWAALAAARQAKREGAQVIFLQRAAPDTGLEGLARTLRREWPRTGVACWTLPYGDASEAALVGSWAGAAAGDLWFTPDGDALASDLGTAVSPRHLPAPVRPGSWLITGGARGVTAACAIELAKATGGCFILAGRSAELPWPAGIVHTLDLATLRGQIAAAVKRGERPAPAAIDKSARAALAGLEIRETLARIRAAGAEAHYIQMDTSDAASVDTALRNVEAHFGAITGLVHGAGIIADRLADEKTEAELARVFAPKAEGLFHILSRINRAALRHVGLFSSASAFFGNRGQCDYAMANAILANAGRTLAAELPGARVKVFDWGPWEGGMVDAALAAHFRQQGVALIPLAEGARIFTHELLAGDPAAVELVIGSIGDEA
ncbi:MAG: SDR family NAD(P)-dependent oxidoreductase [Hyphomonas sp.]